MKKVIILFLAVAFTAPAMAFTISFNVSSDRMKTDVSCSTGQQNSHDKKIPEKCLQVIHACIRISGKANGSSRLSTPLSNILHQAVEMIAPQLLLPHHNELTFHISNRYAPPLINKIPVYLEVKVMLV